jgi:hypothetical protein
MSLFEACIAQTLGETNIAARAGGAFTTAVVMKPKQIQHDGYLERLCPLRNEAGVSAAAVLLSGEMQA